MATDFGVIALRWLALPVVLAACSGKDPYNPGTPLGTYRVKAALTQQTCGGELPNPWEFDVKINRDGQTLYWIQGSLPVSGRLDAKALASFQSTSDVTVRAADRTRAACVVRRDDALNAQFPGAEDFTSFGGKLSYSYAPEDGSDCLDQLGTTFAALPCVVAYSVTASRTAAPDAGN